MAIDFERRKAVMARSRKLGHCVCNPKQPCPCIIFREHNVCPCAGERLPLREGAVPLTQYVRKAGCASKIGQADLSRILAKLPEVKDPNVLVGTAAGDDAGIYRISPDLALVQTVDVFTPCVDDPYLFGQIAAANSLSDVYAMGGKPLTALSVVGFPIEDLDGAMMEAMLFGGIEKLEEGECSLIGGHSINDEEIKCGFAITGLIDVKSTIQRDKARPGDLLVLTKPLGTGMISFAAQIGRASPAALESVGQSMAELNRDAGELMVQLKANACTDVTGFGLAGHLVEMVRGSGVNGVIDLSTLPVFAPVKECIENDVFSGAVERNRDYSMAWIHNEEPEHEKNLAILFDPQTSGGLLVSLPEKKAEAYVKEMRNRGHASTSIIGRIEERKTDEKESRIIVTTARINNLIGKPEGISMKKKKPEAPAQAQSAGTSSGQEFECCAPGGSEMQASAPQSTDRSASVDSLSTFMEFMKQANKPGLIDGRAKKLMAIALSIAQRCRPCLVAHLKGAFEMGIPKAEIDEAANLAISFGGCATMMFYNEVCREIKL